MLVQPDVLGDGTSNCPYGLTYSWNWTAQGFLDPEVATDPPVTIDIVQTNTTTGRLNRI